MYYPKRPVKSFQDLEVYQKALGICVAVVKRIASQGKTSDDGRMDSFQVEEIISKLHRCVLDLPVLIATAHSLRFSDQEGAISKLEEAMLNCNLAVVYLEQYRDIINIKNQKLKIKNTEQKSKIINNPVAEVEIEFFDEQIKNLLTTRMKILHLQRSWKKFMKEVKNA
jgi:hypothetical protein